MHEIKREIAHQTANTAPIAFFYIKAFCQWHLIGQNLTNVLKFQNTDRLVKL